MTSIEALEDEIVKLAQDLWRDSWSTDAKLETLKEMEWRMYRLRNLYYGNQEFE